MERRPTINRSSWTALHLLAFLCTLVASLLSRASAEEPLRVLLLSPSGAEIASRVRGQTRDLPLLLSVTEANASPERLEAERLGREHAAQVVVWSMHAEGGSLRIFVLDLESADLQARDVAAPEGEALAASTMAEIVALVVRSELTSLIQERSARPASTENPTRAKTATAPPREPTPPAPRQETWWLGAGYQGSRPLRGALGHAGALTLRLRLGSFAVGVRGYAAGPIDQASENTRIRLLRFGLRAEALWGFALAPKTSAWLGAEAGCTANRRNTRSVGPAQRSTADALTWSGELGLFGELQWQMLPRLGASLGAGLNFVLWPTQFLDQDATGRQRVAALSRYEPWAIAGLFTRFGR